MKFRITSIAALGLASSVSGALTVCQYDNDKCTGQAKKCDLLVVGTACRDITLIPDIKAGYEAGVGDDNEILFDVFRDTSCYFRKFKELRLKVGQCQKPTRYSNQDEDATFYFKLDGKLITNDDTPVEPRTGAGSFVSSSWLFSVAALVFSMLM